MPIRLPADRKDKPAKLTKLPLIGRAPQSCPSSSACGDRALLFLDAWNLPRADEDRRRLLLRPSHPQPPGRRAARRLHRAPACPAKLPPVTGMHTPRAGGQNPLQVGALWSQGTMQSQGAVGEVMRDIAVAMKTGCPPPR